MTNGQPGTNKDNDAMRLGWVIPTVGIFGAVREMIELSNSLIARGYQVTIYHPDGSPVQWLPCKAKCKPLDALANDSLDALIGITDWQMELYEHIARHSAPIKAITLMGFTPTPELAAALRGDVDTDNEDWLVMRKAIVDGAIVMADSRWQLEWMKSAVPSARIGVPFGGVNTKMFTTNPKISREKWLIGWSNDPRPRKGSDTVKAALNVLKVSEESYWNRRFTQEQMVLFYQRVTVFMDGHKRGGWCNPVAEAMACGAPVVCTDIPANNDFAFDSLTALVVPTDSVEAMVAATQQLMHDPKLRVRLSENALENIRRFSYDKVAETVATFLEKQHA